MGSFSQQLPEQVLNTFQLTQATSIYAFSPVFKVWHEPSQHWYVLKHTRDSAPAAQGIQCWLQALQNLPGGPHGVVAAPEFSPNPRFIGEDHWVVYPFLNGPPYTAEPDQVFAAGQLLGRMHGLAETFEVPHYDWPIQDEASLGDDQEQLRQLQKTYNLPENPDLRLWVQNHPHLRQSLQTASLPMATGTWDYKANNLIFQEHGPVLIDPDSAGYLPRLLDLALAALLFHNEQPTAPPRLFTPTEWSTFLAGYATQIELTELERKLWSQALQWMFLEEALWLLLNDHEAWSQAHQGAFLRDLFLLSPQSHLFFL